MLARVLRACNKALISRYSVRMGVSSGFPAKMPLRAWLGLADERKEERRAALELWLNAAVSLSVRQCPWMRAPLYAFFHIKSHFLRAPVTASPSAQQRQRSTSGASSPPSREVTVQMPPTSVGSLLEIEVRGRNSHFVVSALIVMQSPFHC